MAETCAYCDGDAVDKCSVCGKALCKDHAARALPFLALGEMLKTVFQTLFRAPGTLPALLMEPGDEETFCPDCQRTNSQRRVQEQRKFLYLVLLLALVCGGIILLLVLHPWW